MDGRAPRASGSDAVWRPVGPRPARVYWIRRLVLLAVLVVLVVLLAKSCGGGGATPTGAPGTHPSASSPPATSEPPVKVTSCAAHDLEVTAATNATTYPAGTLPRLSAVVRNVSTRPCRLETSPGARTWTVVSGSDRIWTSSDCTISGVRSNSRLGAGKTVAYALVWNRHRSAKGCPADTPAAGVGTYQLQVTIDGAAADTVVFHLTR